MQGSAAQRQAADHQQADRQRRKTGEVGRAQPTMAPTEASGSTASGAMIMARAAVRRSISGIAPDGTMVSVPTESRSASSMIASAGDLIVSRTRGGAEISKEGQLP